MFGFALSDARRGDDLLLAEAVGGNDFADLRSSKSQRPCLVEQHRVHGSKSFEVEAAFDDGSVMRGAADGAENGERSSGGDATRSRDDHDGNGSPGSVGADEV